MKPAQSLASLKVFSAAAGVDLETCTPREGLAQMLAFFDAVPVIGCNGCDGDMLLFQWGTYDWGSGKHFELNITRQFIEEDAQDDAAISQLTLTYKFESTSELESITAGNLISEGARAANVIRDFATKHQTFVLVADQRPKLVELNHSYV
jgi:hypothetical protein